MSHRQQTEAPVVIRPATEEDWPGIWPIFQAIVVQQETYAYDPDISSDRARTLWLEAPPGLTVVLEDERGAVVGTAKMGPNRQGPGAHIGTASFMVAPTMQGRGVGRALATYVVDWHREHGYRGIQFNAVVQTNEAAVHLWQALGFEILATVPGAHLSPTHGYVGVHLMYLDLT